MDVKKTFLFSYLATIGLFSIGQTYHPFTGNAGWCMEEAVSLGYDFLSLENIGDSIVNGIVYQDIDKYKHFLIREDDTQQKVWVILPDSNSESLLYDFSLKTYDQIVLKPVWFPPVTYLVDTIGFAYTPFGIRKRIHLSTADSNVYHELIWIEGIGSTFGPIYTYYTTNNFKMFGGPFYCLIGAYTLSGEPSYISPDCSLPLDPWPFKGACRSLTTGIDNIPIHKKPAQLGINLDNNILSIRSNKEIDLVQVISVDGKIIDQQKGNGNQLSIQTNRWPGGIYIIKITFYDHQSLIRKIKK